VGHAPKRVVLLGVEPEVLSLGMELSPRVAARVPELCAQVVKELGAIGLAAVPHA
jgi:hydrogenase maturation protease